ncbi:hypothetical protein BH24ACT26_BH24ACT26_00010 [soil metagenome]
MARTHVVMDDKVLEQIDQIAGRRGRSRFLEEAAKEKLARLRLLETLRDTAGAIDSDHPYWGESHSAAEWVRATRGTENTA